MIPLSPVAATHLDALASYYRGLGRDRAVDLLADHLEAACGRYEIRPESFLPAPRPYPALSGLGLRWTKEGPYWIAFENTPGGSAVAGIFHESADIPNRV